MFHFRRLLWEEPGFDPYRGLSDLDGNAQDRSHRFRDVPEDQFFRHSLREDQFRDGQRRSLYSTEDRPYRNPNLSKGEELHPHHRWDVEGRRHSPAGGTRGDGEWYRGGFREQPPSFKTRGQSPYSPPVPDRERSLLTPQSHSDHQHRRMETGWRRGEQETGGGRFRDISPGAGLDDKRVGTGRERQGRWKAQDLNGDRRWEEAHQRETLSERNPPNRQRRDVNGTNHFG